MQLQRYVFWRNLQTDGSEYCSLFQVAQGWMLKGTAISLTSERVPILAEYEIVADESWQTRSVAVRTLSGAESKTLRLITELPGHWQAHGKAVPQYNGCIDVDLGISPSTNTLPIRRLNLAIGQSEDVTAAWVRFPDLALEPLPQRYTRLNEDRYQYESASGFQTELTVDENGLVVVYDKGWERVA